MSIIWNKIYPMSYKKRPKNYFNIQNYNNLDAGKLYRWKVGSNNPVMRIVSLLN